MPEHIVVHEGSYSARFPVGIVHRARLRRICRAISRYVGPAVRSWADFGCSNGFIVERVLAENAHVFSTIVGYDKSRELLAMARSKEIRDAEFREFDLNRRVTVGQRYDLVTCFETLEHVGNHQTAIDNLVDHVEAGGLLILAVPNETGLLGLAKLAARRMIRPETDAEFYGYAKMWRYVTALLLQRRIDGFRRPQTAGYESHLGFDYRSVIDYVEDAYVSCNELARVKFWNSGVSTSVILVWRKGAESATPADCARTVREVVT